MGSFLVIFPHDLSRLHQIEIAGVFYKPAVDGATMEEPLKIDRLPPLFCSSCKSAALEDEGLAKTRPPVEELISVKESLRVHGLVPSLV